MNRELATGVLVSHSRRQCVPDIVRSMLDQPFINEVIVWDNLPDSDSLVFEEHLAEQFGIDVRFFRSENQFTWSRFLAAKESKTELVLTCDDDCYPLNWQEIYDVAYDNPCRIVHCLKHSHRKMPKLVPYNALLGWGSAFRKCWIELFHLYTDRYGVDELLKRKADHIFGVLQPYPALYMPANIHEFPEAWESMALYRRSDHYGLTRLALEKCWKLLVELQSVPFGA